MTERIKVHVLGHTDDPDNDSREPKIRMVTCPEGADLSTDAQKLNSAFQYGQNDFSEGNPEHNTTYSVSVGDVVELDSGLFVVCMMGFQPITPEQFEELVDDMETEQAEQAKNASPLDED